MKEDFQNIKNDLNEIYAKTSFRPIRIRINKEWAEQILEPVARNGFMMKTSEYKTIFGIPLEFDDSIETYEFVYAKDKY